MATHSDRHSPAFPAVKLGGYMEGNTAVAGGSALSSPRGIFVGRDADLRALRTLLTRHLAHSGAESRLVSFREGSLQEARKTRNWNQEELAHRSGVGIRTIGKAENRFPVERNTAEILAQTFGRPLRELEAEPRRDLTSVALQNLIVVHGLPGVGKTTLAAALQNDDELRRDFPDGPLLAHLGKTPDLRSTLGAWGRLLDLPGLERESIADARSCLCAKLQTQRRLLIVDDAWECDPALALSVGGPQCAVLVTTRKPQVADELAPASEDSYPLRVLSELEAVEILSVHAPAPVAAYPKEAAALARELEGLPLAMHVAGRLLRARARTGFDLASLLRELRNAARLLGERAPREAAFHELAEDAPPLTVSALFRLSTGELDETARRCFAWLGPFPEQPARFEIDDVKGQWRDFDIDVEKMVSLLAGHGLLEPAGGGRFWLHALLKAHALELLSEL